MFSVVVTYGNVPDQLFASNVPTKSAAKKLRQVAVRKGYRDAEVWREEDFQAYQAKKSRGQASQGSSNQGGRAVHGVRTFSSTPMAE